MENDNKKKRLTLLVGAIPQTQAAAVTCKFKHTVQPGETITYIANLYQTDWEDIAEANSMQPPYTIVVGTVLCIPEGEKAGNATPSSTKGAAPVLSVVPGLGHVMISVENFPKKTSYYVRVYPGGGDISYRIGHFTTNKEGDFTDWFNLPGFIPMDAKMGVCIKNVWTDAVSCVRYDNPTPYLDTVIAARCSKEGR
jgi:LysM repeat protein